MNVNIYDVRTLGQESSRFLPGHGERPLHQKYFTLQNSNIKLHY